MTFFSFDQLENMTPDTNKMDLSDYERRLFQSVTILIHIGIKQLFTEVGAVILELQLMSLW